MSHEVIQLIAEGHDNFITLLIDKTAGEAAVIDPGWDFDGIIDVIEEEGVTLTAILLTHSHYDHINAVQDLLSERVALFISEQEAAVWKDCPENAILVSDGDQIQFGKEHISVIATPGHTVGGCCYQIGNDLITGDSLFIYGCGRTDLAGGNPHTLFHSLQKLKKLPAKTKIWVGHNYSIVEESTLGEQFAHNPFMMIDNEADFVRYRTEIASRTRKSPYGPITAEQLQADLQNG